MLNKLASRGLIENQSDLNRNVERLRDRQVFRDVGQVYAPFFALPALRGLWLAGSVDQTGLLYDRSGQDRHLTMAGNPTVNLYNNLIPYWDYDGTGDEHTRPDEAGLDITGTETTVAAGIRGLTLGGWFWADTLDQAFLAGKWLTVGDQRSYMLRLETTGVVTAGVSGAGTAATQVSVASAAIAAGAWRFLLMRFVPSTALEVLVDDVWVTNTTSIPASVFAGTAIFGIAHTFVSRLNGRCSVAFLCAAALPNSLINHLYRSSYVPMKT